MQDHMTQFCLIYCFICIKFLDVWLTAVLVDYPLVYEVNFNILLSHWLLSNLQFHSTWYIIEQLKVEVVFLIVYIVKIVPVTFYATKVVVYAALENQLIVFTLWVFDFKFDQPC